MLSFAFSSLMNCVMCSTHTDQTIQSVFFHNEQEDGSLFLLAKSLSPHSLLDKKKKKKSQVMPDTQISVSKIPSCTSKASQCDLSKKRLSKSVSIMLYLLTMTPLLPLQIQTQLIHNFYLPIIQSPHKTQIPPYPLYIVSPHICHHSNKTLERLMKWVLHHTSCPSRITLCPLPPSKSHNKRNTLFLA